VRDGAADDVRAIGPPEAAHLGLVCLLEREDLAEFEAVLLPEEVLASAP